MHLEILQHVPFEGPAYLADWAMQRGHRLHVRHLYAGDPLPHPADFDALIVLGGPMSVHDEAQHAWLRHEKAAIAQALQAQRPLFGVCLGAQLIAQVLGARVRPNTEREIGWFDLELTAAARADPRFARLPTHSTAFHWHGERFDIPDGALHLARSAACEQQGFLYQGRVLGLQAHLEVIPASVAALCEHCSDELRPGAWVQDAGKMCAAPAEAFTPLHELLAQLLDVTLL